MGYLSSRRYRLSVPAEKYAPWFGVVLKCARLAVKVLQTLSQESRASKLRCGWQQPL